jgi:hypothetical protein
VLRPGCIYQIYYSFLTKPLSPGQRTIGRLFDDLCDEVNELDWAVELQQLIEILQDALKDTSKEIQKMIKCQLQQWIKGLPNYIKAICRFHSAKVEILIVIKFLF